MDDRNALQQMYMIAREALMNAAKHSGADRVAIKVTGNGGSLRVAVEDNGRGLDGDNGKAPKGMGMRIMRYRAEMIGASLQIGSGSGGGTQVECTYRRGKTKDG